jgi:hypothetical protein
MVDGPLVLVHDSSNSNPIILEHGKVVKLPFQVNDAVSDPITFSYIFDNAEDWQEFDSHNSPNVWPGSIFSDLNPKSHIYYI